MNHDGPVRLVVFDFDGTLCDSADIKTIAFRQLYFEERGEEFAEEVERYHLRNAGVSRYDKIRHIEESMIGVPPSDERVGEVAARFSRLVEDAVVAAPLFPGVREFLDRWSDDIPFTVASATPTDELRRIVDRKRLGRFFRNVDGSPRSKAAIIATHRADFAVAPDEAVMVGDQPSDADAAREAGTGGVMITDGGAWASPFPTFPDFISAMESLESRLAVAAEQ